MDSCIKSFFDFQNTLAFHFAHTVDIFLECGDLYINQVMSSGFVIAIFLTYQYVLRFMANINENIFLYISLKYM